MTARATDRQTEPGTPEATPESTELETLEDAHYVSCNGCGQQLVAEPGSKLRHIAAGEHEVVPPYTGPRQPVLLPADGSPPLPAELHGKTILMQKFTTRDFIGIRGRAWGDLQVAERTLDAILEYVPDEDPLDLAPEQLFVITSAWIAARFEDALPPATA